MISMKVTARNRIPELRQNLRPRAGRAINEWARAVFDVSQQLVPVDTGVLKGSGGIVNYADPVGDGRQRGVAKAVAYTAPYALWVHNGTAHMAGTPYLLAAFESARPRLVEDLSRIFSLND